MQTWSDADSKTELPCPICGGVGFLRKDVPVGHPEFGRAIPCECKQREMQQADLHGTRQSSGLYFLTQMTFSSFRPDGLGLNPEKQKNLHQAYDCAREFAREGKGWFLLKGGYGCGKTHLAAAIANDRLARGESVLLVVVPDLLDHLRSAFAPTSRVSYDDRFEAIRSTPFLILDDLGAQVPTAWAQEKLFQLLNYRYNSRLPTVITTNREFGELDPRIRSRLADRDLCQTVTILAHDYRHGDNSEITAISNLALYGRMTFDTFDLRTGELEADERRNLQRIFNIAKEYAEKPSGFIVFTGEFGCGKTHLAAAVANALRDRGHEVLFAVVPDLLGHLRAAFAPDSTISYDRRFENTRTAPFLVLDDLGTENATAWAREKLFQIIDYRYVARLPTVITIHRDANIDDRIRTRVFDLALGSVNEVTAPGYRTTHPRARGHPQGVFGKSRGSRQRGE